MIERNSFLSFPAKVAIPFIAKHEGFRAKAYKCPAGILTIGYGHTEGVQEGDEITQEKALDLLEKDIQKAALGLATCINVTVSEGQYIALASLAFNVGPTYVKRSCPKLLRNLNAGRDYEAAQEFLDIVKSNGKVLPGLVRRRREEAELFCPGSVPKGK